MYKDFKKSETLDTGFTSGNSLLWMFSGIVLGLIVGLGLYFFTNNKIPSISMIDSLEQKIQTAQTKNPNQPLKNPAVASVAKKPNTSAFKTSKPKVEEKERKNKFSYYAVLPNLDVPVGSAKPINTSAAAASVAVKNMDESTEKSLSQQYEEAVKKQNSQDITDVVKVVDNSNTSEEKNASIGDYLLQVASFKKQSMANKTKGRLSNKGIDAYIQKKKIKGRYWYRVVAGPVNQSSVNNWKNTAEQLGHKPLVISVR